MDKPVCLGLSISDTRKIAMYEYWYDYIKLKYEDNTKLCYMDTNSFIVNVKREGIYAAIAPDDETRFDTSNFDVKIPLPIG